MIAYLQVDYWAASNLLPPSIRKVRLVGTLVDASSSSSLCSPSSFILFTGVVRHC